MAESEEDELQRLRRSLYRPDPPPGALQRVEALLAARSVPIGPPAPGPPAPEVDAVAAAPADEAPSPDPSGSRPSRRRARTVAAATATVAAIGVVLVALQPPVPRGTASALAPALSPSDAARLDRALDAETAPWGPTGAGATLVDVVQAADLPQLDVWHDRDAFGWVQRGTGPMHRDLGTGRPARTTAQPLSIVLRCDDDARYRWTIRGTSPGSDVVQVLAGGDADHCDQATVATAVLPARSRITAFDLRVARDVGWTMAIVTPAA